MIRLKKNDLVENKNDPVEIDNNRAENNNDPVEKNC